MPDDLDPGVYGDFDLPPGTPAGVGERCPNCGRAIEWAPETKNNGEREWWIGASAECDCGLELYWMPNRKDRLEQRRRTAQDRWLAKKATGQQELF